MMPNRVSSLGAALILLALSAPSNGQIRGGDLGAMVPPALREAVLSEGACLVIINHEEQYAIWPSGSLAVPEGWRTIKREGTLAEVSNYIEEVWTDMRPLSVRKWMDERKLEPEAAEYRVVVSPVETTEAVMIEKHPKDPEAWTLPSGYWGYMLWPSEMPLEKGLRDTDHGGSIEEATDYIEEVWTDMRPLSIQILEKSAPGFGDRRK